MSANTGHTTASGGAEPTGSTVTIGVAASLTGGNASLTPEAVAVATAWGNYVNANGGVGGHKINIAVEDNKTDAATGQAVVQDLVQNKHAAAMIILDTTTEVATSSYLQSQHIPLLGIGYTTSIYGVLPNVFQTSSSLQGYLVGLPLAAKADGLTSFGAVVCAEYVTCSQAAPILKSATQAAGLRYTGLETAAAAAPNYTAQCLQLIGDKTELMFVGLQPAVGTRVVQNCQQQGYQGLYGTTAGAARIADLTKLTGTKWIGNLHGFPWWVNDAPVAAFRDAMKKYAPDLDYRTPTATAMWSTLQLFAKALSKNTGAVTPASVIEAYGNIKNETLDGLLPQTVTFTANKPGPVITCFWPIKYSAGDKNPVLLPTQGKSGNGQTGDLATTCVS